MQLVVERDLLLEVDTQRSFQEVDEDSQVQRVNEKGSSVQQVEEDMPVEWVKSRREEGSREEKEEKQGWEPVLFRRAHQRVAVAVGILSRSESFLDTLQSPLGEPAPAGILHALGRVLEVLVGGSSADIASAVGELVQEYLQDEAQAA